MKKLITAALLTAAIFTTGCSSFGGMQSSSGSYMGSGGNQGIPNSPTGAVSISG